MSTLGWVIVVIVVIIVLSIYAVAKAWDRCVVEGHGSSLCWVANKFYRVAKFVLSQV